MDGDTLDIAKEKFSKQILSCAPETPFIPTFNEKNILPHASLLQELF
jgi:hypothetical protein